MLPVFGLGGEIEDLSGFQVNEVRDSPKVSGNPMKVLFFAHVTEV
jgi:hypothetical protein